MATGLAYFDRLPPELRTMIYREHFDLILNGWNGYESCLPYRDVFLDHLQQPLAIQNVTLRLREEYRLANYTTSNGQSTSFIIHGVRNLEFLLYNFENYAFPLRHSWIESLTLGLDIAGRIFGDSLGIPAQSRTLRRLFPNLKVFSLTLVARRVAFWLSSPQHRYEVIRSLLVAWDGVPRVEVYTTQCSNLPELTGAVRQVLGSNEMFANMELMPGNGPLSVERYGIEAIRASDCERKRGAGQEMEGRGEKNGRKNEENEHSSGENLDDKDDGQEKGQNGGRNGEQNGEQSGGPNDDQNDDQRDGHNDKQNGDQNGDQDSDQSDTQSDSQKKAQTPKKKKSKTPLHKSDTEEHQTHTHQQQPTKPNPHATAAAHKAGTKSSIDNVPKRERKPTRQAALNSGLAGQKRARAGVDLPAWMEEEGAEEDDDDGDDERGDGIKERKKIPKDDAKVSGQKRSERIGAGAAAGAAGLEKEEGGISRQVKRRKLGDSGSSERGARVVEREGKGQADVKAGDGKRKVVKKKGVARKVEKR